MFGGFAVRPHPDYALVTVAFAATTNSYMTGQVLDVDGGAGII